MSSDLPVAFSRHRAPCPRCVQMWELMQGALFWGTHSLSISLGSAITDKLVILPAPPPALTLTPPELQRPGVQALG